MEQGSLTNHPFSEAGFSDVGAGSELFKLLKVDEGTFKDPREFSKLKDVAQFFDKVPDANFIISKMMRKGGNTNIKPLDRAWTFVELQRRRSDLQTKLKDTEKEIGYYE